MIDAIIPGIVRKFRAEYPELVVAIERIVEQFNLVDRSLASINSTLTTDPIAAGYSSTITAVGAGAYLWDTELFSTSVDHFAIITAGASLEIRIAGYYLFTTTVRIDNLAAQSDVGIYKNAVIQQQSRATATATGTTHNLTCILKMEFGDYIQVKNLAGDRFGDANCYSTLFVTRL